MVARRVLVVDTSLDFLYLHVNEVMNQPSKVHVGLFFDPPALSTPLPNPQRARLPQDGATTSRKGPGGDICA